MTAFNVPSIAALAIPVVASETFSRTRHAGGSWENGLWVSTPGVTTTGLRGSIQPMRGRMLLRIPANRRNAEWIAIYTLADLQDGKKRAGVGDQAQEADRIAWQGNIYEIESVEPWNGRFYSAVAVRVGDQ